MAVHSNRSTSLEMNPVRDRASLPWWTWIAPFFVANLGTWLSIWFKTDPGTSYWYLPTALGIIMVYWWGPRAILGVYLNAVICAPLWDLPWQWSFLYALPETIEVGLSWFLFIKLSGGKYWLPNLRDVRLFIVFGSILPAVITNTYLVLQLYFLGDITRSTVFDNWRILLSADLVTQYVLTVPMLIIFSSRVHKKGWTKTAEDIPHIPLLSLNNSNSRRDILFVMGILFAALILITYPVTRDYWALHGILMIVLAIRYGVNIAVIGTSWIGFLAYLLPIVLTNKLGLPTSSYDNLLAINFNILFLSGVTLITGRVISDLSAEIVERKQSEEKLQQSELRLRAIIDTSPDSITLTDLQGNIQMANRQSAIMYGYTDPADLINIHILRLIVPEDHPRLIELAGLTPELNNTNEFRLRRRDGTTFPGELRASVLTGENGKPQAIVGIMRDIADRKQADEYLRAAEAKYRTLVEQIPPIIYIADPDQHIGVTYISPRIRIMGFSPEEWIADPELWLRQIHADDRQKVLADIDLSVTNGNPFHSEYRILTRDGEIRWFLDDVVDVRSGEGELLFRHGFMLDITERKQAEELLTSRERYLELLNHMTQTILRSTDIDKILHTLAVAMAELVNADGCYIARWDEDRQRVIPVATTFEIERPYASFQDAPSDDLKMALSVLDVRHALAADDIYDSPYVNIDFVKRYPARSILGIPLIAGEHKLGAAIIAFNTPHHFTPEEIDQAEQAGHQVALALQYFEQGLEVQQRLKESNALALIGRALSATEHTGTGKVLQLIVNSALDLISQAEGSVIHLLDSEEQVLIAQAVSGFSGQDASSQRVQMKLGEGVAGQVINQGITINIGDIEHDARFIRSAMLPNFRSLLVAPVQSGQKQIGTISVQSNKEFAFNTRDVELLKALGIQAAIAIENTHLFETTQQQLKEVDALYKISQGLAASLDTDQLIKDVVILLLQNFGYYHVQIYTVDLVNGDLVLKSGSSRSGNQQLELGFRLPRGTGVVGHVVETGEPFLTNNVNGVVFFHRNPLLPDTQSELTVPIKVNSQVVSVLDIQHTPPNRFNDDELHLMMVVAEQLGVALQKANLYQELQTALQQETNIRSQLIQNERLALVGRLLASVSHELNNPLQAIQNALFLLKDETRLSEQATQDLNIILSETERMAALIEQLRSTYRPVRTQDFLPVQLNNLIEDVYMLIATHLRHKEIVFEFAPDPGLPDIQGLSDQLRQVVLNLFLNAVEVMKPGGRLTVQTRSLLQQNEVLLTVRDTGPGIDLEILPRIFEPFITSKYTGTGLGLTITHDIIQHHHGRVQAENDPQGGAVFTIWLPVDEKG